MQLLCIRVPYGEHDTTPQSGQADGQAQNGHGRYPCKKPEARNGTRTRDLHLGKVALYQLSYSRILILYIMCVCLSNYTAICLGNF